MSKVGWQGGALVVGAAVWWLAAAGLASAESALRLPYPEVFGAIPASTYDANHQRVGDATLLIEDLGNHHVRMLVESGIDGGAHTIATADFVSVEDGRYLKLVRQESRSLDADGIPMGVLSIDHEGGVASCDKREGDGVKSEQLTLPDQDHVANVPLNLLFQPLVDGTAKEVTFQLLLCRFGARLIDIDAHVVPRSPDTPESNPIIEVEYEPNFGSFVSLMAQKWIPKLSIWFDPRGKNPWVAHRVPLYSKGPEVFVIRDGTPGAWLGIAN